MRIKIFNVDHGFCSFVRTPSNLGIMIDCGCSQSFSPVDYVLTKEVPTLVRVDGYALLQLIISHPHHDHINDIKKIIANLPPRTLQANRDYNWQKILQDSDFNSAFMEYHKMVNYYNTPIAPLDFGEMKLSTPYLSISEALSISETDYINNSSIPVFIEYAGRKIFFAGDLMSNGLEVLLKEPSFCELLMGTDILVAPHHGHRSGFTEELFSVMGKPLITIVSISSNNPHVDNRYSDSNHASGLLINGEIRRMLTTRCDGTIDIEISAEGALNILTENQPKIDYEYLAKLLEISQPQYPASLSEAFYSSLPRQSQKLTDAILKSFLK